MLFRFYFQIPSYFFAFSIFLLKMHKKLLTDSLRFVILIPLFISYGKELLLYMKYIERVLAELNKKYENQPEFLQAAREVLDSIAPRSGKERSALRKKRDPRTHR